MTRLKVCLFTAAAALSLGGYASAATYTDSAAFNAAVQPGAYVEDFSSYTDLASDNAPFTNGTFSYNATAKGLFGETQYILVFDFSGNNYMTSSGGFSGPVTLTFTSGNITAVGGAFFLDSPIYGVVNSTVTLTFSDGTTQTLTGQDNTSFFGYTSATPIASLTLSPDASNHWIGIDNLVVGSAAAASSIPEPASLAVLGLGAAAMVRRRR